MSWNLMSCGVISEYGSTDTQLQSFPNVFRRQCLTQTAHLCIAVVASCPVLSLLQNWDILFGFVDGAGRTIKLTNCHLDL